MTMTITSRRTGLLPLALHLLRVATVDSAALFETLHAPAFVAPSPPSASASLTRHHHAVVVASASSSFPALHHSSIDKEEDGNHYFGGGGEGGDHHRDDEITRRGLLRSTVLAGTAAATASLGVGPSPALAAAATAVAPTTTAAKNVPGVLCDPSVSTWVKTYDDDGATMRQVHILGTAHISSASAELAGRLVRDLKPDVVFVELDAKRVARAIPGGAGGSVASSGGGGGGSGGGDSSAPPAQESDAGSSAGKETMAAVATTGSIVSTPGGASDDGPPKRSNPFDVQSKLVNVGSKYVGGAVKGMYGKLESEGFKAGDEFAMSVREGLAIGSTIVLGDRDVEVTLQRLTRALAKTDIRKLLSADSEVNSSMEAMLPEGMKSQLSRQSNGGGSVAGGDSMSVTGMGMGGDDIAIERGEFQAFVETMKAKENVKKVMVALRSTAPEIYEAMVAERDVYMARGLDELGNTLGAGSPVDNTVAVMGMAHVDGVESYLSSRGWKEMTYPCPVVR